MGLDQAEIANTADEVLSPASCLIAAVHDYWVDHHHVSLGLRVYDHPFAGQSIHCHPSQSHPGAALRPDLQQGHAAAELPSEVQCLSGLLISGS